VTERSLQGRLSGGLTRRPHKRLSTSSPIRRGFVAPQLIVPLEQYRLLPANACVKPGQRVLRGEALSAPARGAATVHAPTSGTVTAIEDRPVLLGGTIREVPCVIMDSDGAHEESLGDRPPNWPEDAAGQLAAIADAGIVGLGGAAFPTADKLAACAPCRTLIINGVECEPYISCDDVLMREHACDIVDGAQLITDILGAPECIIAIEDDKPEALAAIRDAVGVIGDDRLTVAEVPTVYPAGGELQLIEFLTGREIPAGSYPAESGVLTQNAGTAYAVHRLARLHEPLMSRIVTITGGAITSPCNVDALIGTPLRDLIELCGGYACPPARLIAGGSMMGVALSRDDLPVTQATNCILAAAPGELREDYGEWPCIRCGECATACPVHLLPQELHRAAEHNDFATLQALGLRDCMECGCCDAVCPSHITLTEQFRVARRALQTHEDRNRFSTVSAERYQLREQRRRDELESEISQQEQLRQQVGVDADARRRAIEAARQRARERRSADADSSSDGDAPDEGRT
jgi:Na+-translocating ferredoxin:NAD+ oxidoreductase subunit C